MPEPRESLAEWQQGLLDDADDRANEFIRWVEEAEPEPQYALAVAATALALIAALVFDRLVEMPAERIDEALTDEIDSTVLTIRKSICARMGDRVTPRFHRETSRLDIQTS